MAVVHPAGVRWAGRNWGEHTRCTGNKNTKMKICVSQTFWAPPPARCLGKPMGGERKRKRERERGRRRPPRVRERSAGSGGCIHCQMKRVFLCFWREPLGVKFGNFRVGFRSRAAKVLYFLLPGTPGAPRNACRPDSVRRRRVFHAATFATDPSATWRRAAAKMKTYGFCYHTGHRARHVAAPKAQTRKK